MALDATIAALDAIIIANNLTNGATVDSPNPKMVGLLRTAVKELKLLNDALLTNGKITPTLLTEAILPQGVVPDGSGNVDLSKTFNFEYWKTKTGYAPGKMPRINAAGTDIEFIDVPTGGGGPQATANAGVDKTQAADSVTLTALGTVPSGQTPQYLWSLDSQPPYANGTPGVQFNNGTNTGATVAAINLVTGTTTFRVRVTDPVDASIYKEDTVAITRT